LMFPNNDFLPLICLYLLIITALISSYFLENERIKRILENGSLILSAVFYLIVIKLDINEKISLLEQLPFLISFGLFLYFKLLRYFHRNKKMDSNET
jgi:hypothetical protein